MPHFEVWSEGFAATGEFSPAKKEGEAVAETFREACQIVCGHLNYYTPADNRLWGMRLFDNEQDAREFLG